MTGLWRKSLSGSGGVLCSEAGGEFAHLEAEALDEVDEGSDIDGFPAEAEQEQVQADAEHLHSEEQALFQEEAREVCTVSGGVEGEDSQFAMKLVEIRGEVVQVGTEDGDAAEAELVSDFGSIAGLGGEELEIGLTEKTRHGAKANGVTQRGNDGGAGRSPQSGEEENEPGGKNKGRHTGDKEHRILDHGTPL